MAFTSITPNAGVTTIKVSALSDVSGITLERSGDGYVIKYTNPITRANDTLATDTTKVRIVVGVGTLESVQKEYSLGLNVGEVRIDASNPLKTEWGSLLSEQMHFAWINGTPGNDTYDFTDTTSPSSVSSATRLLMADKKRGIWVDLGNGNDTVKGSAYGDNFSVYSASSNDTSSNVKRIDGGANEGATPWGNQATDMVDVFIQLNEADYTNTANITALVASITVSAVSSSDANGLGYTYVLKRGDTVLAYLKNVEQVNIQLWRDYNGDSVVSWNLNEATWAKNIQLAVNVGEIRLDPTDNTKTDWGVKLTEAYHYAWINGTLAADTIVADNLVSDTTKARMVTNKRGVFIDAGDGDDIITGSPYSDNIVGGSGNDKVDGGDNTAPTGDKPQDVFEIRLTAADQTAAQALLSKIKVVPSTDSYYTWMVQRYNDADIVVETDYLINIEAVQINVSHPTTNQWLAGRWKAIALDVSEIRLNKTDATKTEWGSNLSDQMQFAWVNGTGATEVFDYTGATAGAATVSSATKALMVQYQRGLSVDMGGGNDKIVGSPYGDNFSIYAANFSIFGLGTRYIDGGTNLGKNSGGNAAKDFLDVFVESKSQADLIQVSSLSGSASPGSEEAIAVAGGYTSKILIGTRVLAYVKGIESVNIQIWNDRNGDGQRWWDPVADKNEMTWVTSIRLAVDVNEIRVSTSDATKTEWGSSLSDAFHMAWINGTDTVDTINANSILSTATKALETQYKRGIYIDAGAGNDIITGTDYSDNIVGGTGNDLVDGGTQISPSDQRGQDVFEIRLTAADPDAAKALLSKIKVLPSTDSNYTWMVQRYNDAGTPVETDYLINIEAVQINVSHPTTNQWLAGRWQPIALNVNELRLSKTDPTLTEWNSKVSDQMHFAWVNGTASNESFDYTGTTVGADTISAATKALMTQNKRGLWVDLGTGNDSVVGSPFGDAFTVTQSSSTGISFIDGSENEGTTPWGNRAIDNLDVFVANRTLAAGVTVTTLSASPAVGSPEATAKARNFTSKVKSGDTILAFIKNIEYVNVQVWDDKNGDGQRQWDQDNLKNEMSWYANFRLTVDINEMRLNATDSSRTEWGTNVADQFHFAWINGTDGNETIAASSLISSRISALQAQYKRGVFIDAGLGNDKITGTDYSDNIVGGAGDDEIDGGTQLALTGTRGEDVFEIKLTASNENDAKALLARVKVLPSEKAEFQWKVVQVSDSNVVVETDYLKNIETVRINVQQTSNNQWLAGKTIYIALNVGEIRVSSTDSTKTDWGGKLSDQNTYAWVNGTSVSEEKFDYTGITVGADTLSASTKALMVRDKKGVSIDMGGGSDTAVGSPYGDWFNILASDTGIDYYDGGDNLGTTNWGSNAQDNVDVYVDSLAVAGTISTVKLVRGTSQIATDDSRAFDAGYTFKILKGTSTLAYIKNIERVNLQVWTDRNDDGKRDYPGEVQYVSGTDLIPTLYYSTTGDATKNSISINATLSPETINVADILKTLPSSTDSKLNWAGTTLEINVTADQGIQGNDILIGSNNPDVFTIGKGTNYIDGGANQGRFSWANSSSQNTYDFLQIIVGSELEARYVQITPVATGVDDVAITGGYLYKVVNGDSVTYLKNVEQVSTKIWIDANNNGTKDWSTEVFNFNSFILQSPLISWTQGVKGGGAAPPTTVIIGGSAYTPNIDATALINSFIDERKAYPTSSTDLAPSFKLSDIANFSSSFGAYIHVGSGDHVIKGTEFTDVLLVAPNGNNIIKGGEDKGYYIFNGGIVSSLDSLRITEKVNFEIITLPQSFIKITAGSTKAFSNNNTPSSSGDDVPGNYILKTSDLVTFALLPKDGEIGFNATAAQMQAYGKAFLEADTPAKLQAAITAVSAVAVVKYSVLAGYTNIGGSSASEWMSFANLSNPTFTSTEVQFTGVSVADNFLSTDNMLGSARFNIGRQHLINTALNTDLLSGATATSQDTAAINAFATSKGVNASDFKYALVTFNDFQQITGVQLIDDIEKIEFRLWFDSNLDGKQVGNEITSSNFSRYLNSDNLIHLPGDLNSSILAGKQYAGTYSGTSLSETIDLKTLMQSQIGAAEQAKKLGIRMADFEGNDTITGTDFDDFFWLGRGVDSIDGGNGTDRLGFFWKPSAAATLEIIQSNTNANEFSLVQKTSGSVSTPLAKITLTDTGGTFLQLNSSLTATYGTTSNFAMTTADTFTNIEEIVVLLDPSLKLANGTFPYTTGGISDVNPFILKIKPTADYPLGADATKSSITITGTPYADTINASTLIQQLPTSSTAKDDWKNSNLNTFITMSGGGDTLVGSNYSDLIDPGTGVNYIDGGSNIGRTAWTPAWVSASRAYWGAEAALDHVRFYIKQASDASRLEIVKLSSSSTGTDKTAFDTGYTTKATFRDYNDQISTNYLKNIEYVGLRTWIDSNSNNIRETSEATATYSYFAIDTAVVNYRFVDLNNSSNGLYLFDISLGKYVDSVNAQNAIDTYLTNRKNYPVLKEDKVTLDFPSDYKLSDYVNYNHAYGAYIMAGLGEHYIVGTNYADMIVASDVGNNWYDGGTDIGYAKYGSTANSTTGQITVAKDYYRIGHSVSSQNAVDTTSSISKDGYKVIRLSDNYDLLNSTYATNDTDTLAEITSVTTALKAKFGIGASISPQYAVVKFNPTNNQILGVDLLRNIETFQMRNWFDADGNTRPNGNELSDASYNNIDLLVENTLYQTADQTYMTVYGMNYAGSVLGTSLDNFLDLQTSLTTMLEANTDVTNNNRGLIYSDRSGSDSTTGTNFNDFIWLSRGTDIIDAGTGTQDRVGLFWQPTAAGSAISSSTSTDKKIITVTQTQGGNSTNLMRFTLNDTNPIDKYWSVEQLDTNFAKIFGQVNYGSTSGLTAATLRGVEQVVFALPPTLINSSDQPTISLTGLVSNLNAFVVDLTVV
jgi:hypothetical protein